ncbi:MAG: type II toxin-antitoxin system HicA family toxin [Bacteroides sp.]|nr:type II toxin-antitoxin system HicA family toxin [Bacteroides sp.]
MTYSELKKLLKKNGCYFLREGGNHDIWYSPITNSQFPVGRHDSQEVRRGTFQAIKKQSGIK